MAVARVCDVANFLTKDIIDMSSGKKVGKKLKEADAPPTSYRAGWEKLVELADKLAEQKQYKQAEDLCYAVLLSYGPKEHVDDVISTTMHKVSRLRQKHIYPEHYILK